MRSIGSGIFSTSVRVRSTLFLSVGDEAVFDVVVKSEGMASVFVSVFSAGVKEIGWLDSFLEAAVKSMGLVFCEFLEAAVRSRGMVYC